MLEDLGSSGSGWSDYVNVYVPSLSSFVSIHKITGESASIHVFYFQSDDCTGISYIDAPTTYNINEFGEKYYTGVRTAPVEIEPHSALRSFGCHYYDRRKYVVPAEEVSDLPFTFPVALPLQFK